MAKINVLILTHLSRTNTGVFFKIFEILLFSFFFFARVRANGETCISKRGNLFSYFIWTRGGEKCTKYYNARSLENGKRGNRAFLIVNLNAKSFAAGKLEREGEGKEEKFSR